MLDFLKNFLDLKDAWEQFLENTELKTLDWMPIIFFVYRNS